jgi:polysaccharide export outer membrane protein
MHYINKYLYTLAFLCVASNSLAETPAAPAPASFTPYYILSPGDVLEISVWKEEGLQKEVLVRPDGGISFPMVGELQAGGKTTAQVHAEIITRVKRYIPDPVVTVSLLKINTKVYVVGKVKRPGDFVITQYTDVMQALAMAGGLDPYAKSGDIQILRRVQGKEKSLEFDYDEVAKGKNLDQNIMLQNGDVVVVP